MCFFKTPASGKDKPQAGPSKSPSLTEIKSKLSTAAKEVRLSTFFLQMTSLNWMSDVWLSWWFIGLFHQGKPLPKTEQKFENFVRSSFKISDKKVSHLKSFNMLCMLFVCMFLRALITRHLRLFFVFLRVHLLHLVQFIHIFLLFLLLQSVHIVS